MYYSGHELLGFLLFSPTYDPANQAMKEKESA